MKGYLIDRDGVLTRAGDGHPIAGSVEWMNRVIESGTPCLVASNHTTSGPEAAAEKLASVGFKIGPEHMHTPLTILTDYLKKQDPGRIMISGTDQLRSYIQNQGYEVVDGPPAETLLMGFNRQMTYEKLMVCIDVVMTHKARVIALHRNRLFKDEHGRMEPGLGAWVTALEYATNTEALIVGKPNRYYYEAALERMGTKADETVMVSDDPFSDLTGAIDAGLKTVFVTSGKYPDPDILKQLPDDMQPDMILERLGLVG